MLTLAAVARADTITVGPITVVGRIERLNDKTVRFRAFGMTLTLPKSHARLAAKRYPAARVTRPPKNAPAADWAKAGETALLHNQPALAYECYAEAFARDDSSAAAAAGALRGVLDPARGATDWLAEAVVKRRTREAARAHATRLAARPETTREVRAAARQALAAASDDYTKALAQLDRYRRGQAALLKCAAWLTVRLELELAGKAGVRVRAALATAVTTARQKLMARVQAAARTEAPLDHAARAAFQAAVDALDARLRALLQTPWAIPVLRTLAARGLGVVSRALDRLAVVADLAERFSAADALTNSLAEWTASWRPQLSRARFDPAAERVALNRELADQNARDLKAAGASPLEVALFRRVNDYRDRLGLRRATFAPVLSRAAHAHATNMRRRRFFGHLDPDKQTPENRVAAAGMQAARVFENLYKSPSATKLDAREVLGAWRHSPKHHAVLLATSADLRGGLAVVRQYVALLWATPKR